MYFKKILIIILILFIPHNTLSDSLTEERTFNIFAKVPLLPKINIMEIYTKLKLEDDRYRYNFQIESKNIVDFINPVNGRGLVIGSTNNGYKPMKYSYKYTRKNKNKLVEIIYEDEKINEVINIPEYDKSNLTPVLDEMLIDTIDPSTFFLTVLDYNNMKECERSFKIYDGKRRYNVDFEKSTQNYENAKIECHASQTKLGGYKNEDNERDVFASSDYIRVIYSLDNKEFLGYEAKNGNISILINENRK